MWEIQTQTEKLMLGVSDTLKCRFLFAWKNEFVHVKQIITVHWKMNMWEKAPKMNRLFKVFCSVAWKSLFLNILIVFLI